MIPHERSLVENWKNRPFAIIGVNSDGTTKEGGLEKYKKNAKEMGVTWRSFANEANDPSISDVWKVTGWPTLYIIDHKGIIRHKGLRGEKMEEALDALIKVAEQDAK
jgi:hypothetical protein